MQQNNGYVLEQSRNDKIEALGFLCYNLYIDGSMTFPNADEIVDGIKADLNFLLTLRKNDINPSYLQMQEDSLNEKLIELGCICYNLYIDNKLFNNKVLSLCDSISSINHEIANGLVPSARVDYGSQNHMEMNNAEGEYKNTTQSKLKITCPYGMEQIPVNFKRCRCGYRNRNDAKYCAKCGAKLS